MNKYQQGIQIVDAPEEKVSKYQVAAKAVLEAPEGKAIKISRQVFGVGSQKHQIRGFMTNFRLYCLKKHQVEVDCLSQNGSIFVQRKQD